FVPYQFNQWACDFVQRQAAASRPFFLQYSLGLVHWAPGGGLTDTPLNPGATAQNTSQADLYRAMMTYMDQMVGKLLNTIEEAGIAKNTVVVFAGDNGTWNQITSTWNGRPVQGGKLTSKDTGSWVPLYVRWPGVVKEGSTYEGMTDFSDLFPTFLTMAGAVVPNYRVIDGISFLPQLKGAEEEHREMVYAGQLWGAPNNPSNRRFEFVRDKRHKLVVDGASERLYDVSRSPLAERLITVENQTPAQQEARTKLRDHLRKLHATELSETGADSDRDGSTDFAEVIAGTDPTSSRSKLAIVRVGISDFAGDRTCTLRFPTVAGRLYRVQSAITLEGGGWTNVAGPVAGNGEDAELTAPADERSRFYRLTTERR
nr:sulfatase-like hydrolase/transferase [Akkermansiaceae bacterium]